MEKIRRKDSHTVVNSGSTADVKEVQKHTKKIQCDCTKHIHYTALNKQ